MIHITQRARWLLRYVNLALFTGLIASCSLSPTQIPPAPVHPTMAVVFDIDGTLTPKPIFVYRAREQAAEVVNLYSSKGFQVVYLSARVSWLQKQIPPWLERNGFPHGPIHVPQNRQQQNDPQQFKQAILQGYISKGWSFVAAYGDSSSDFNAYLAAGIPQQRIYALKRQGAEQCHPGPWSHCFANWSQPLPAIRNLAPP